MTPRTFFNQYLYYSLIFVLSLVSLVFLPMVGTELGMAFILPDTLIGWVIFVVASITSAILNVLMFHFFVKQGKVNIKDDANYKRALQLLYDNEIHTNERPLSPRAWHTREYTKKGLSLFVFTVLGTISFGQAILAFNLAKFLSQAITLIIGLVCGFMEMKATEEYWTVQFPEYAELHVKEIQKEQQEAKVAAEATPPADKEN